MRRSYSGHFGKAQALSRRHWRLRDDYATRPNDGKASAETTFRSQSTLKSPLAHQDFRSTLAAEYRALEASGRAALLAAAPAESRVPMQSSPRTPVSAAASFARSSLSLFLALPLTRSLSRLSWLGGSRKIVCWPPARRPELARCAWLTQLGAPVWPELLASFSLLARSPQTLLAAAVAAAPASLAV